MAEQALAGVKVLDLSHYIAGPYCTRILAGFGADVIKVEKPGEGDPARRIGPFLNDEPGPERSGLFLYLNINKKSITLNLKTDAGAKIFKELAKDSDIVLESFSPGVMERLGLNYETLEKINPRLVVTSISNFGQTGPYRDYKSAHLITFGMSIVHHSERPVLVGGWLSHYLAGIHGAAGTATALYQRKEAGIGQHVDISIWESSLLSALYPMVRYSYTGQGYVTRLPGPVSVVCTCKDGYIGLNAFTPIQLEMMCNFLGVPELTEDQRISYDEVIATLASQVVGREKMELFESGAEWRIPFSLIPTTQEILDLPQHKARGFFQETEHPVIGKVTMPGAPFRMTETPWQLISPAPLLGEHNEEIYCDRLGYTKDDLVRMREQGII